MRLIALLVFGVFIRIARKKFIKHGGKTAAHILQAVDALQSFLLYASIALLLMVVFIIFNITRSLEHERRG